jgi:hypothetical protein
MGPNARGDGIMNNKLLASALAAGFVLATPGVVFAQIGLSNGRGAPSYIQPGFQTVEPAPVQVAPRYRAAPRRVARGAQRETTGSSTSTGKRSVNR